MDYLKTKVFGYALDCGHSWNRKINADPKTEKGLIKSLNESALACNNYNDYYESATKEDLENSEYDISRMN